MRFLVRSSDGPTVRDVLVQAGVDAIAVREGRVFVGRRRVTREDEAVTPGDALEVAPSSSSPALPVRILRHERDLVAVDKPAGIPTIPDHSGSVHSLLVRAAERLSLDPARLHPTSRLDRDVSGVVFFALTRAAAERLKMARADGSYERRYLAITASRPRSEGGTWDAPIGRARRPRLRAAFGRDAVPARTRYVVSAASACGPVMLAIAPQTGRTHQIRVHASHAGAALVGDRDYGGATRVTLPTGRVLEPHRIALHAARVVVPGSDGRPLVARSPVPSELEELWSALGGEPAAWELSASCAVD
jgi:23S rRNA-/tRNA-specific pseudouridylate synthase